MKNQPISQIVAKLSSEKKAKRTTLPQFIQHLIQLSQGNYTKGFLIMSADHKMNKRGNELFGRVKKLSGWGFDVNADYSRKVNLQREREGLSMDFEALPTWAEKVNDIIYRHKTETHKLYMSVFPSKNFGTFVSYFVDGRPATESEMATIREFTPEKSESSRQGTDKKVEIRRPSLNNVLLASLGGKRMFLFENYNELTAEINEMAKTA
jgi:hypothetical protein